MSCRRVRRRLSPYLEGELGGREADRLRAHLEGCAGCAEELVALRRSVELLRGLPDVEPPPHLAGRVIARLRDGEAEPSTAGRLAAALGEPRAALVAGVAALLVGVAVVRLGDLGGAAGPETDPEALRAALRQEPPAAPDLGLTPPFGASADPGADLDALLDTALESPEALLHAWRALPADEREAFAARLAERARQRGNADRLAEALRRVGDEASGLAGRLEVEGPAGPEAAPGSAGQGF